MQNKVIKTAVLLLVAIACIAGCRKCSEIEDRPLTYLDSLPVLTETAQILDARYPTYRTENNSSCPTYRTKNEQRYYKKVSS